MSQEDNSGSFAGFHFFIIYFDSILLTKRTSSFLLSVPQKMQNEKLKSKFLAKTYTSHTLQRQCISKPDVRHITYQLVFVDVSCLIYE